MSVTKVVFKCESFIDGHPVGPVTLIDEEAFADDPVVAECRAQGKPGIPFDYTPQGITKIDPWVSRREAVEIAHQHNVELTEEGW